MARSRKIKKKKSFMFTTKHHSFVGIMGVVLFALSISINITSIVFSFHNRGEVDISFGYYGFLAALLNIIGVFSGISGLREKDAYPVGPWIAIGGNAFMILWWALLIVLSRV